MDRHPARPRASGENFCGKASPSARDDPKEHAPATASLTAESRRLGNVSLREGQSATLDFPTCVCDASLCDVVDATLNRAGPFYPQEPCAVSNVNKTTAPALSTTALFTTSRHCCTTSRHLLAVTSSDADFDALVREMWSSHLATLGSLGASKGWGGNYWKIWYDGMVLDVDNCRSHGATRAVKSDTSSASCATNVGCGVGEADASRDAVFHADGFDADVVVVLTVQSLDLGVLQGR